MERVIPKKCVLAIENLQFMSYFVILAIGNTFLWQSRTLFVYQNGCSRLPRIRCEPCFSKVCDQTSINFMSVHVTSHLGNTIWFSFFDPGFLLEQFKSIIETRNAAFRPNMHKEKQSPIVGSMQAG